MDILCRRSRTHGAHVLFQFCRSARAEARYREIQLYLIGGQRTAKTKKRTSIACQERYLDKDHHKVSCGFTFVSMPQIGYAQLPLVMCLTNSIQSVLVSCSTISVLYSWRYSWKEACDNIRDIMSGAFEPVSIPENWRRNFLNKNNCEYGKATVCDKVCSFWLTTRLRFYLDLKWEDFV